MLQFNQQRVDWVMFVSLAAEANIMNLFSTVADAQHYSPGYALSSIAAPAVLAQNAPKDQLANASGFLAAFDAKTVKEIWRFKTIPVPGEPGHETWENDAWKHGGATVWQTPAVDPELGLIYFSTGNPGPDFNGRVRAGNNLFSVSILAVEAKTGKYRWHFQQVHHDIWDYDSPNPVILFDVRINGRVRKAVAGASFSAAIMKSRKTGAATWPPVSSSPRLSGSSKPI